MNLTTLDEKLSKLPLARRNKIAGRVKELVAEEMTMRELRKAHMLTQCDMAKKLGIRQAQVSRMEKRADMHISTLRKTVEAMGGELTMVASFPDKPSVKIGGFAELAS